MKLSTFSQALPLVLFFSRRAYANPPEDGGSKNHFFPHGTPPPDDDQYIVHYNDAKGKSAIKSMADKVVHELGPQKAVAVKIRDSKKLVGLANSQGVGTIEKDQVRFPLGMGSVRGHGGSVTTSLESFTEELLKSTGGDLKTSPRTGRRLAETTPYGIGLVQADPSTNGLTPGAGSNTTMVCIIDGGYDQNHEDLPGGPDNGGTASGPGSLNDWGYDGCNHGTHVAGTIVGMGNNNKGVRGVIADGSIEVYTVRVFEGPNCGWTYSSGLIAAVNQCVSGAGGKKVVVNMSLGGGGFSNTENNAFNNLYSQGVLSIAAAGNDGNTAYSYPASYPNVVSVAAIDSTKTLASFSQRNDQVELSGPGVSVLSTVGMGMGIDVSFSAGGTGYEAQKMDGSATGLSVTGTLVNCGIADTPCPNAAGKVCLIARGSISFAEKVDNCISGSGVAAVIYNNVAGSISGTLNGNRNIPAVSISQADGQKALGKVDSSSTVTVNTGNYDSYDGTSMATPHVVGVAALVWSHHPTCSAAEIRAALAASADDLGATGRDTSYGHGLVQAADAVTYLNDNACSGGGGGGGGTGPTSPPPSCNALGASCSVDGDCCSNKCRGRSGRKTCK